MNKENAKNLLRMALDNANADFRSDQWEAIDALVNHRQKLLVVQRTGWGKSLVYFISAKIFRDRGLGLTIIISPLLALMRNQIESAKRLGIRAETINSSNTKDWQVIIERIKNNQLDCLLISPERLANDEFIETVLLPISARIALMVIDEAHCISDWGHDFRPDYRRIVNIIQRLPKNMPVLGTTATANDRVINDIQTQLGDIQIQRGCLIRESLALQNISVPDQASRLAWLAQTIPQLAGTGIVYTLTTRDAEQVATWLNQNGIDAKAYHGGIQHPNFVDANGKPDTNRYRLYLEDLLLNNQLKVLVATTALGMGYDKPDLSFVIHYQMPSSVVAYYQQVGRAGRGIDYAVGILMSGAEDNDIHNYFRTTAFPSLKHINEILNALSNSDGLSIRALEAQTNLRYGQIEKVLKFLSIESPSPIIKIKSEWHRTPVAFQLNQDRINHLTQQREQEWQQMQEYLHTKTCLMNYLRHALDDSSLETCGRCENCQGQPILATNIEALIAHRAASFLKHAEMPIKPKIQVAANAFAEYSFGSKFKPELQAQEGRVLSRWGDAGWGTMVANNKHANHFSDELVDAMAEMITQRWKPDCFPTWICCVPSQKHPHLVPDFAKRLAEKLNLPFINVIQKVKSNQAQKLQQNRFHQCHNLDGVFAVSPSIPNEPVFLVDDIVDSGWTLAVLAALLQQAGSGQVYPIALASTSVKNT